MNVVWFENDRLGTSTASRSDVDNFRLDELKSGRACVIIRGERCATKASALDEFSAAFQFPLYFGNNWDAFDECISDLSWLVGSALTVLVNNAALLETDPSVGKNIIGTLRNICGSGVAPFEMQGPTRSVSVIFVEESRPLNTFTSFVKSCS